MDSHWGKSCNSYTTNFVYKILDPLSVLPILSYFIGYPNFSYIMYRCTSTLIVFNIVFNSIMVLKTIVWLEC